MYAATTLNEREATYANVLLNDNAVALDGAIVNFAFTGNAGADTDDALVENLDIVADVATFHEEVAVANGGGFVFVGASGNDYIFADAVVVANDYVRFAAFDKVKVLRGSTNYGVLINNIARTHCCSFENAYVGFDYAVVANDNAFFNVGKGAYFYVLS